MPRANTPAAADPQPENGLAALEAKVEEVQIEAAIEAELTAEDAALAAAPLSPEEIAPAAADLGGEARPAAEAAAAQTTGAATSVLGALQDIGQATLSFHTETFASFTAARSPQDLLAAQAAYGQRVMGLYAQNLARLTQALPTLATFAPR